MTETATSTAPTIVSARVTDPAYSALTVGAGTLLLLGTTSTVAVSTVELASALS